MIKFHSRSSLLMRNNQNNQTESRKRVNNKSKKLRFNNRNKQVPKRNKKNILVIESIYSY